MTDAREIQEAETACTIRQGQAFRIYALTSKVLCYPRHARFGAITFNGGRA